MERDRQRRERAPELATPGYAELLEQALTMPGELSSAYSRFRQYSLNNQVLLFMQGVTGPVATYAKWQEMDRQVKKGSRAKSILRPILYKERDDAGTEVSKLRGFKMVRCIFELDDTEGEPLPPYEPSQWSPSKALETLGITEVPFNYMDGNTMGYPSARRSPSAHSRRTH